jgi:hypothetical protein
MDFFKNVSVNIKSNGAASVLIVWMLCLTTLALYGESPMAHVIAGGLSGFGIYVLRALGAGDDE